MCSSSRLSLQRPVLWEAKKGPQKTLPHQAHPRRLWSCRSPRSLFLSSNCPQDKSQIPEGLWQEHYLTLYPSEPKILTTNSLQRLREKQCVLLPSISSSLEVIPSARTKLSLSLWTFNTNCSRSTENAGNSWPQPSVTLYSVPRASLRTFHAFPGIHSL